MRLKVLIHTAKPTFGIFEPELDFQEGEFLVEFEVKPQILVFSIDEPITYGYGS